MLQAQDDFRRADVAHARAQRRYASALARAHCEPKLDLVAVYDAEIRAEVRRARALKRMMTE